MYSHANYLSVSRIDDLTKQLSANIDALVVTDPLFDYAVVNEEESSKNRKKREEIDNLWQAHNVNNAEIEMDKTTAFSITDPTISRDTARFIASCLLKHHLHAKEAVITDGTACTGGNVFEFAHFFQHVNAVEFNITRAQMLLRNVTALKLPNVCAFDNDITHPKLLHETEMFKKGSVLFLDPPWGGPGYQRIRNLTLSLGEEGAEVGLAEVCIRWSRFAQFIALKLPRNFALTQFLKDVGGVFTLLENIEMYNNVYQTRPVFYVIILKKNSDAAQQRAAEHRTQQYRKPRGHLRNNRDW